jgi:hypothetical protein
MASAGSGLTDKVTNEKRNTARNAGGGRREAPIFLICFFFWSKLEERSRSFLGLCAHRSLEPVYIERVEGGLFRWLSGEIIKFKNKKKTRTRASWTRCVSVDVFSSVTTLECSQSQFPSCPYLNNDIPLFIGMALSRFLPCIFCFW